MKTMALAGCVITDTSGKVLLIHRNTVRLKQWEMPGGKVEDGETLPEAAIRETLEEIGVQVRIVKPLGGTQFEDNGTLWDYSWFKAEIIEGVPALLEADKHDDLKYFDLLDPSIHRISLSPNIKALIATLKKS